MSKKHKEDLFQLPEGAKVLLHACCAPCSSAILEAMDMRDIRPTVFYSNSNIFPDEEYITRRDELLRYAREYSVPVIDDTYDHSAWQEIAIGLEDEPERGQRCLQCFIYRLKRAAAYAHENGFTHLATTLASSRWKDLSQVDAAGEIACSEYPDLTWWGNNWRKGGLQERRNQIIKEREFYNQQYCGCEFSMLRLTEKDSD